MSRIAMLTNVNPNVDAKANYFVDYFHLFLSQLGRCVDFELENPLALIDKILFQLENNLDSCEPTIKSYLAHPMFSDDVQYLLAFDNYTSVKLMFDEWLSIDKKQQRKKQLNDNMVHWMSTIKPFREDLSKHMFEKSLKEIISFLTCVCDLPAHKIEIRNHARILLTEFIFRGVGKEYISYVFHRILSREIDEYPFPAEVETEKQKVDYIENRTFEQQFMALEKLVHETGTKVVLYYKIYGASLPKEATFEYDGVQFYSKQHKQCRLLKKKHPHFFKGDSNYFVAGTSVEFLYSQGAIRQALKQIDVGLKYMSAILKRNFIIDQKDNYIIANEFGSDEAWTSRGYRYSYQEKDIDRLKKSPFHILDTVQNGATDHFLNFEALFINASNEESMPAYWHYLEALMQVYKKGTGLMEKVATISILSETGLRKGIAMEELASALNFLNLPRKRLGITVEEGVVLVQEIMKGNFTEGLRAIDYPAVTELVAYGDCQLTMHDYKKCKEYYVRILQDAYAQRNFFIHQGSSSNKSHYKLVYSLPTIVHRFRSILIEALKTGQHITFTGLVDDLYDQGCHLLNNVPKSSI